MIIIKMKKAYLSWFSACATIRSIREGGRTVGSGRVATIIE